MAFDPVTGWSVKPPGGPTIGQKIGAGILSGNLAGIAPPGTAPGAAPAAAGAVGDPGHWQQPDWPALLAQFLGPFQAQSSAETAADAASRDAAFQRSLIGFGEVPGNLPGSFNIGSGTAADAAANTAAGTSTVARINQAHNDNLNAVTNNLAARGILQSGELGYQRGREDLGYTQAQYDARNQLLDYLNGLQQGFVQADRQRKMMLAQQAASMAAQLAGMYQPQWVPGSTIPAPPPTPTSTIGYGQGAFAAPPKPKVPFKWGV